jgi:hypothetical protein
VQLSRYRQNPNGCPILTKCGVSRQGLHKRQQKSVQRKTRRHTWTGGHDEANKRLSLTMRTRLKTSFRHSGPNFEQEQQQQNSTRTDNACLLSAGTDALCSLPTSSTDPTHRPHAATPSTPVQFSTFYRSPSHPLTRISLATVRQAPRTGGINNRPWWATEQKISSAVLTSILRTLSLASV